MRKILLLLIVTFSVLVSSEIGTIYGLDPNGDGFLSLRKKPKSTEIGRLYNGNKVKILDRRGKYYKVKDIQSSKVGWAHSNWIRKGNSTSSKRLHVIRIPSNDTLSVRSGAGIHNRKIGDLAYNATGIKKIKCKNAPSGKRWCKVSHSSTSTGWVMAKYISSKTKTTSTSTKKSYSKPRKRHFSTGSYVCSTWSSGANGWCGYITQNLGNSVRVENYKVKCGRGGFLGICTNISGGSCTGNVRLFVDEDYKNPRSLIVPKSCLD